MLLHDKWYHVTIVLIWYAIINCVALDTRSTNGLG